MKLILQPNHLRLGDHLQAQFRATNWDRFRAAVAFAKQAGVAHVTPDLATFSRRAAVTMVVGKDLNGTSYEAIRDLHAALAPGSDLWLFHNPAPTRPTFHPKIYLFADAHRALLTIGSGNLTRGGLYTNYEGSVTLDLDLSKATDAAVLGEVEREFDRWGPKSEGTTSLRVTALTLASLLANSELLPERLTRPVDEDSDASPAGNAPKSKLKSSFMPVGVRGAPALPQRPRPDAPAKSSGGPSKAVVASRPGGRGAEAVADAVSRAQNVPRVQHLRWCKQLPRNDAQQPINPNSNVRGILGLSQAGWSITAATYFREEFFGSEDWVDNGEKQECEVEFTIDFPGRAPEQRRLRISHKPARDADQANIVTHLHWGRDLIAWLRAHSQVGNWVTMERREDGRYFLQIQKDRPRWAP